MANHEQELGERTRTGSFPSNMDTQQDVIEGIDLQEVIGTFFRRWRLMAATFILVVALGTAYTLTRHPIYESSAKIVVASDGRGGGGASDGDMPLLSDLKALTRSRSVDTQVEIVSSPDLLDEAYNRLSPRTRAEGFKSNKFPDWACKVTSKRNTDVIVITGRAYTKKAARLLANTVAATYFKRDLEESNQATRQARQYAEQRMTIAEKDLASANTDLARFKEKTGLVAPDVQLAKTAEQMAQLSLELDSAKAESASGDKAVQSIEAQLPAMQANVTQSTTITENPEFSAIVQKVNDLNSDRASLLQEYTPQSPEVVKIDGTIKQEQQRMKEVARTIVGTTTNARNPVRDSLSAKYADTVTALVASKAKASAIQSELSELEASAKSLPETERQLTERMRRVDLLEKSYEMLSSKYYTLLLSEQAVLPNGILISQARLPQFSAYPKRGMNAALFMLLGFILAVGVAIAAERLDSTVHDQSLVEKSTGLAILSVIPEVMDAKPSLIINPDNHSALMESYRILRNNVAFSAVGRDLKTLAVTSPGPGEGKSTTSVNLAVAMAMEGKKILLVDCDLRRPNVHKQLNISRNIGFTNVVTGSISLADAVVPTECNGLYCLPSGPIPPNPTEFLNSKQSRAVFDQMVEEYDMIIVDCPPSSGLSDMQVISTVVDGIVLVIGMGKTMKPHLDITMRAFSQAEAPLLGFVMNRVDTRQQVYGYHYYYYYDYSERSDSQTKHKSRRRRRAA